MTDAVQRPRRVLVLGGTAWLGRAIVTELLAGGSDVVCLARGSSGDVPEGATLVRADRTEAGAYDAVASEEWDEVVELAYVPELVGPALDVLADSARHWTLVSSVSVYARDDVAGDDESAPLVEPSDPSDYAHAKVLAERATRETLSDRLLVVRPGLIVGPGDGSDRFGYWPARFARGGTVLVPETAQRAVQVVDVRDLAAFVVRAAARGVVGVVDAVGEPWSFDDVLGLVGEVADARATAEPGGAAAREVVVADDAWLLAHDVRWWAGPRSLPLWLPVEAVGFARRAGVRFRELDGPRTTMRETVERVLDDEVQRGLDRERRSGLPAALEAALVRELVAGKVSRD